MTPPSAHLGPVLAHEDGFSETDEPVEDDRSRMSFLEHLDELRRRILYSVYALVICCLPTFYFWDTLFAFYVRYFSKYGGQLMYSQPMAGFTFSLKVSALAGALIASPFIFSQIWLFIAPGLYAKEKKVVLPFVFFSSSLFIGGAYFGHVAGFPAMWRFFASYEIEGLKFLPQLDVAFTMYVWVVLGLGAVFQMPMFVYFLARFGIVTAKFMLKQFKYAVLIIVIVAAVITPSGDPLTLTLFSAPMIVLYVISIGVAAIFGKKKPKLAEGDR
jgi:sec-independent protein translocase protein TatC